MPSTTTSPAQEDYDSATARLTPYTAYVTLVMGLSWAVLAIPNISPAFIDPTLCANNCTENSFVTVPDYFNISRAHHRPELTTSMYYLGSLLIGQVPMLFADSIGRRPILLISTVGTAAGTLISALAPSYFIFLAGRLIQGSFWTAGTAISWVLCSECLPITAHARALIFFYAMWTIGYCLVAPLVTFTAHWRTMYLISSGVTAAYAALQYLTTRESIGFLTANGKYKEAEAWMKSAYRFNRIFIKETFESDAQRDEREAMNQPADPEDDSEETDIGEVKQTVLRTALGALSDKGVVLHLLIFMYAWTTDFAVYTGLALTSTGLTVGDPIMNYIFSGIVEMPSAIISPLLMDRIGRKTTARLSHLLTAVALLSTIWITQDFGRIYLIFWMTAKMATGASFFSLFIYASEVFPIKYRSICIGAAGTISNLGAIVAPFLTQLSTIRPWLTTALYGAFSLVTVIIVGGLPETIHK